MNFLDQTAEAVNTDFENYPHRDKINAVIARAVKARATDESAVVPLADWWLKQSPRMPYVPLAPAKVLAFEKIHAAAETPPNLTVALRLAGAGLAVFPCDWKPGTDGKVSKKPLTGKGGFRNATTKEAKIREWWRTSPHALVGINLEALGLIVVDSDRHEPGKDGVAALAQLEADNEPFDRHPITVTHSGGHHHYFRQPAGEELGNGEGALPDGINIRGKGYVVAAGSVIPDDMPLPGAWVADEDAPDLIEAFTSDTIPELPMWFVEILQAKPERAAPDAPESARTYEKTEAGNRERAYAQGALDGCYKELAGLTDGRNQTLNPIAYHMGRMVARRWIDRSEVERRLEAACVTNGEWQHKGAKQCRDTIKSGLEAGLRNPHPDLTDDGRAYAYTDDGTRYDAKTGEIQEPRGIVSVCAASLAGKPRPGRCWICEDWIPDRNVTLFQGDGGVGKSLTALQLAVAVALVETWLGMSVTRGVAIYLSAEDGLDELHNRLCDITESEGVNLADLTDLHLLPFAGVDAILASLDKKTGLLTHTALWESLRLTVETHRPKLLVLDTSADVYGGDENVRVQVRSFITLLRGLALEFNMGVVLLSHPSLTGISSGTGTSGSTGWNNSVRSRIYQSRIITAEDRRSVELDPDARVITRMKANYAQKGAEIRVRWQQGCFKVDGPQVGSDSVGAHARANALFMELLDMLAAQGRYVSPALTSGNNAAKVFAQHPDAGGATKMVFRQAMERLLAVGTIEAVPDGPPSKGKQKLVRKIAARLPAED